MKKYLTIAVWEFKEKVKRKSFIISMIITPLLIILVGLIPTLVSSAEETRPQPIGILDLTGKYFDDFVDALSKLKLEDGQPEFVIMGLHNDNSSIERMQNRYDKFVFENDIDGYLIINEDKEITIKYRSNSVGNFTKLMKLEKSFNEVLISSRLREANLKTEQIKNMLSKTYIKTVQIQESGKDTEADLLNTFLSAYFFIMVFIMMILFTGGMLVRSLIEEKSSRLIEVLLSSCTTDDILKGKILGLTMLGLFQISVWALVGFFVFGTGILSITSLHNSHLQLIYFILGYFLYTAIFVGVGSIVTTDHEAQQITGYISFILIIPIVVSIQVIQNPDSLLATIFTYFPLTTTPLMLLKLNIVTPPLHEILITIALTILFTIFIIKISSKIFKIGILWYGKKPGLKELKNWLSNNPK
ncbi:MAG: ABC transporter permease [bacterium]